MELISPTETTLAARRIISRPAEPTRPAQLAQTLDVDVTLRAGEVRELPGMPGFPVRSLDVALDYIEQARNLGVQTVAVRIGGTPGSKKSAIYSFGPLTVSTYDGAEEDQTATGLEVIVHSHQEALMRIRDEFPRGDLQIVADPYGVAPNRDGTWGIKNGAGIDLARSEILLDRLSIAYAQAGADAIFSLGRFGHEVAVMRRAVSTTGLPTQIWSLSGNTESQTIYVYLPLPETHGDSGQLVLTGQLHERLIQTIIDIHEGSSVVVVKPCDHLHLLALTYLLVTDPSFVRTTLDSPATVRMAEARPDIAAMLTAIRDDLPAWTEAARQVDICGYAVSGQYYTHSLLEAGRGSEFVAKITAELYEEIRSCGGNRFKLIFDRHASWYLTHQPKSSDHRS